MSARPQHPLLLDAAILGERARLVRLCARLTGNWDAAEDLAQETLVEAWRALDKLRDPGGLAPWLTAIARHVCLRWRRERGREYAHLALPSLTAANSPGLSVTADIALDELPAGDDELTVVLERAELAELLDRALALLPAETRAALVGSYLHELPQADLAARLGMSEGALRVRLHRGKLALRRALETHLRDDALALGLAVSDAPAAPAWHESRIWCPFCGSHRLAIRMDRETGEYAFRCVGHCHDGIHLVGQGRRRELLAALSSPKSILARHCLEVGEYYRRALAGDPGVCPRCGATLRARTLDSEHAPYPILALGMSLSCPACPDMADINSPWHLTIDTDAVQRFWRRHPRMRALPARAVELDGRPAVLTSFQSLETLDRLDVFAAHDTYEVLRLDGDALQ
jgi:RNA polymerase sigma-70 factor (ECF subfamily)